MIKRNREEQLRPLRDYEFMAVLQREVDRYKSDAAAATAFGVSRSHLSRVLRDQKPVTARLAHAIGYQIEPLFVPYEYRR